MSRPYNVLEIACFVVNKHNELYSERCITNLRLQKLLYFIQAYFIIKTGSICFNERIVAWPYGPVVIEAYEEFKKYGRSNIETVKCYGAFDIPFYEDKIDCNDKDIIISVINMFRDYADSRLVDITHSQSPWQNSIDNGIGTEIRIEDMRMFFLEENDG